MKNLLNIDGAGYVDITGLYEQAAWPDITFEHYEDDGSTPITLEGEWKMRIWLPANPGHPSLVMTELNGLSIEENILSVKKPDSVELAANTYQYSISNKVDDHVSIYYYGSITIKRMQPWQQA